MIEMQRSSFHISWRFFLAGVLLCLIQIDLLEALKGSAVVLQNKNKKDEIQVEGLGTAENITLPDGTVIPVNITAVKSNLTGIPQLDYIYDPNLPRELNGQNLTDYPFYNGVPEDIDFKCDGLHDGFYASVPHKCQVYHHCLFGTRYDFLCANYTAFDQRTFICHFVSEVDCDNSPKHFKRNEALYKQAETTTPKPPPTTTTTTTTEAPPPSNGGGGGRRGGNGRRRPYRRRRPVYEYYYDDEEEMQDSDYYEDDPPQYVRRKPANSGRAHRNGGHKKNRNQEDSDYESDHAKDDVVKPSVRTSDSPSVFERPRVPPKIRRPVPKNERDKYDYMPKKSGSETSSTSTSTAAPTKETKKKSQTAASDAEYYDDEYYDDVKPPAKHKSNADRGERPRPRHRPNKKRVQETYDEYEEEVPQVKPKKKQQQEQASEAHPTEQRGTRVGSFHGQPKESDKPRAGGGTRVGSFHGQPKESDKPRAGGEHFRNGPRKPIKEEEKTTRKPVEQKPVEQKPAYEDEEYYYDDEEYEYDAPAKKDKNTPESPKPRDEGKRKEEPRFRPTEKPIEKPSERPRVNSSGKQDRGQENDNYDRNQQSREQERDQDRRDQKTEYNTRPTKHEEEAVDYDNRGRKQNARPNSGNTDSGSRNQEYEGQSAYETTKKEGQRNSDADRGSRPRGQSSGGDRGNRNRESSYDDSRSSQEEAQPSASKYKPSSTTRSKGERPEEPVKPSQQPEEYVDYEGESEIKEKSRPAENTRQPIPNYAKSATSTTTRKYYQERTSSVEPSSTTSNYRQQGQFEEQSERLGRPERLEPSPFQKPQQAGNNFRTYYQQPSQKSEIYQNTEIRDPPPPPVKEKPSRPSNNRDVTLPPTNSELLHRKPTAQPIDPLNIRTKQNKFLQPQEPMDYQAPFLETSLDYKSRGSAALVRPSAPEGFSLRNKPNLMSEQERTQSFGQSEAGSLKNMGPPQPFSHSNKESTYSQSENINARQPYRPKFSLVTGPSSLSGPSGPDQSTLNNKKSQQSTENPSNEATKTLTLTGPGSTYLENTGLSEPRIKYPKLPITSSGLGTSYQRPETIRNGKPSFPTGLGQRSKLSGYSGSIIPPAIIKQLDVTAPGPSGTGGRQPAQTSTIRNNGIQENDQLDYEEEYDVTLNDALQPSTLHPTRSLALSGSFAQDPLLSPSIKGRRTISPPPRKQQDPAYLISDTSQQYFNSQREVGYRGSLAQQTETRPIQTYNEQQNVESERLPTGSGSSRRKPKQPETPPRVVLRSEDLRSRPTATAEETGPPGPGVWVIQQTPRRLVNKPPVIAYDDFY